MGKLIILVLCLSLVACADSLAIDIKASEQLNPNTDNQSLPVVLKIYQLNEQQRFNGASYHDLLEDDFTYLGTSLLDTYEITIKPGAQFRIKLNKHINIRYLAAVAFYRQPQAKRWQAIKPIYSTWSPLEFSKTLFLNNKQISWS